MANIKDEMDFAIDEVLAMRLKDLYFIANAAETLEDPNSKFNAESELHDKEDLLRNHLHRAVQSVYAKHHGAGDSEKHS